MEMERQKNVRLNVQGLVNIVKKTQGFFLLTNLCILIWDHVAFNNINDIIELHYILYLSKKYDIRLRSQSLYYCHDCPYAGTRLSDIR